MVPVVDVTPLSPGQSPSDRKTKAGAFGLVGLIAPSKTLEEEWHELGRDAVSVIGNRNRRGARIDRFDCNDKGAFPYRSALG